MILKTTFKIAFFVLLNTIIFHSCAESKTSEEDEIEKKVYVAEKNEVSIIVLENRSFQKELVSNGKLIAIQKNSLKFDVGEKLEQLFVKNGDFVKKNQVLAVLNQFKYQQALERARIDLKKTSLDFEDMLLGRGIFTTNKDSIDKDIYDMVASRSGFDLSRLQLETANFDMEATKLIAPFSGKVANLEFKQHEYINAGEDFLTLINDNVFEVAFYLIESEINEVEINNTVEVIPFATDKTYTGRISSINPLVEKNGTILVKAVVKNDDKLTEGMNVKVRIQREIKDQLVVPKSAVILRQNQEVLFKVVDGKAYWTYVNTTLENSSSYSIIPDPNKSSATLQQGDTIIIGGNLNLAHDSDVTIK